MEIETKSMEDVALRSIDDKLRVIDQRLEKAVETLGFILRVTSIGKQGVDIVLNPEPEEPEMDYDKLFPTPNQMQEKVAAIRQRLLEG